LRISTAPAGAVPSARAPMIASRHATAAAMSRVLISAPFVQIRSTIAPPSTMRHLVGRLVPSVPRVSLVAPLFRRLFLGGLHVAGGPQIGAGTAGQVRRCGAAGAVALVSGRAARRWRHEGEASVGAGVVDLDVVAVPVLADEGVGRREIDVGSVGA